MDPTLDFDYALLKPGPEYDEYLFVIKDTVTQTEVQEFFDSKEYEIEGGEGEWFIADDEATIYIADGEIIHGFQVSPKDDPTNFIKKFYEEFGALPYPDNDEKKIKEKDINAYLSKLGLKQIDFKK